MPRIARPVLAGAPMHITQRGNNKQTVFYDDIDRSIFMSMFIRYAKKHKVNIHSYCLMDNHYHAACTPTKKTSLAKLFSQTNWGYAVHHNIKYGKCGRLWQERYASCFLIGIHLPRAMRYIERNPVKAGMVDVPNEWKWSSARATCGIQPIPTFLKLPEWWYKAFGTAKWKEFIEKEGHQNTDRGLSTAPRSYKWKTN
ncbi:transposase [PVC group bacterium]|nr:transposase [PVC group bacterium]